MQKEKKFTLEPILEWAKNNGWHIFIVNSSAVFNPKLGIYLNSQAPVGCSDLLGCTPEGIAAYIETKAKGKKQTLKQHQRDFLLRGIQLGAFCCCVDSLQELQTLFYMWSNLPEKEEKKHFLKTNLPDIKPLKPPKKIEI